MKVKKALSGLLIGGILMTGGLAYAATDSYAPGSINGGKFGFKLKDALEQLVFKGTITQDQSTSISNALPKPPHESIQQLVTDNNLTQEQANAIMNGLHMGPRVADENQERQNPFNQIVSQGIITQEQADTILSKLPKPGDSNQAGRIRPDELIKQLVSEGILTQEQADAMANIKGQRQQRDNRPDAEAVLSQLVTQGTITQTQADLVLTILPNKENKDAAPAKPGEIINQLVDSGTITQSQADAILEMAPKKPEKPAPMKEGRQGKKPPFGGQKQAEKLQ